MKTRFFQKFTVTVSGCWIWTGAITGSRYGAIQEDAPGTRMLLAHRVIYEMNVGPIPTDLELDHLCRNTLCVNPDHLEAVPHRVNLMRSRAVSALNAQKTHCPKGHPYDEANTIYRNKRRHCRRCSEDFQRKRRHS